MTRSSRHDSAGRLAQLIPPGAASTDTTSVTPPRRRLDQLPGLAPFGTAAGTPLARQAFRQREQPHCAQGAPAPTTASAGQSGASHRQRGAYAVFSPRTTGPSGRCSRPLLTSRTALVLLAAMFVGTAAEMLTCISDGDAAGAMPTGPAAEAARGMAFRRLVGS
jgi:hypothetical protein